MKIQEFNLDDIKPYWRNPRNNAGAVEAVKKSIADYGFNSPIIVDAQKVIIAGHTRYKALMEMGWKKAPCVVLDLPAAKAKEYRIADNKTSELSTWDMTALIPELREIGTIGDLQIYFPEEDLSGLLKETATAPTVTQAQIDKRQTEMDTRFTEGNAAVTGQYVEIICPHCAEAFFLDKAEMNRAPASVKPE